MAVGSSGSGDGGGKPSGSKVDQQQSHHEISALEYGFYYFLAFWAYWFGPEIFDTDNDGDFDAEDVYKFLHKKKTQKKGVKPSKPPSQAAGKAWAGGVKPATVGQQGSAPHDDGGGILDDIEDMLDADVVGEAQEDKAMKNFRLPFFIIIQCSVAFLVWFVGAAMMKREGSFFGQFAGLDTIVPDATTLKLTHDCEDYRFEIWRWFLYQFSHVGVSHVGMNCVLNVILGSPLDMFHGSGRLALMFNIGVFGGACAYVVSDAHNTVVGMSGGCYALFGIHYADLVLNWNKKKFRYPQLIVLLALVIVDLLNYFFMASENTSNAAHFGGAIAGFMIGINFAVDLKETKIEKYAKWFFLIAGIALVAFCVIWDASHWPPSNIWESDGFCWVRFVYNPVFTGDEWKCVACGDQACIAQWGAEEHVREASHSFCTSSDIWLDVKNLPGSA